MNKQTKTFLALIPLVAFCSSCKSYVKVNELAEYIFVTDTYTQLDHKFADEYYAKQYDNWGGGGCSAVSYMVDGDRLVGRNMDLNISNKAAYIVKAETGKYKTLGLAYTFRDFAPNYSEVKKQGVESDFAKILPFMCDDVLNEKGLHIELNMRHAEFWPNGDDMFACEGTNPEAERRVHMFELPRLVGENCQTVAEAIDYLSTLNIYSQNRYWNYCFLISDAHKGCALIEFCLNKTYIIHEEDIPLYNNFLKKVEKIDYEFTAVCQTNFYMNYTAFLMQNTKTGMGRFETLQRGVESVTSKREMFDLMDKVAYSNFYLPYEECKNFHFDPRSEQIGEFTGASYEIMMNPDFEPYIAQAMDEYSAPIRAMTREQKQNKNEYWESTFTEVVDCNNKNIVVRFFENNEKIYKIDFENITKISKDEI